MTSILKQIIESDEQVHFSIEMFLNDDTSFSSCPFDGVLFIRNYMTRLTKHRKLSPVNKFFLTLCRLKRGLSEEDLAYRLLSFPAYCIKHIINMDQIVVLQVF